MTTYPMPCNTRPAAAPIMGRVSGCPAACGRRCGGTILARQNLRLYGTRLQTKTRPNKGERPQRRLSTVSTVRNSLSTVKVWTLLFNADNDLRAFLLFVHSVHTFFEHGCEENSHTPCPAAGQTARPMAIMRIIRIQQKVLPWVFPPRVNSASSARYFQPRPKGL